MTKDQTRHLKAKPLWRIVLGALLVVLLSMAGFFLIQKTSQKSHPPQAIVSFHLNQDLLTSDKDPRFHYLRNASFMGNQFIMLSHRHSSQRLIMLLGPENQSAAYSQFYDRPLSSQEMALFIQLFKTGSSFKNKTVTIRQISLGESGLVHQGELSLPFKRYDILTTVNQAPQKFEAYLGLIQPKSGKPMGLIFTFNSRHYASKAPLEDLLISLSAKPGKAQK